MVSDLTAVVKSFDTTQGTSTISWPLEGIQFAEQLIYKILDSKNVKPSFRTLFGLKISNLSYWLQYKANRKRFFKHSTLKDELTSSTNDNLKGLIHSSTLWLSPNASIQKLIQDSDGELELELRMRFRPSSYARICKLDPILFDMIYAQIRHDFIHTKFNEEKKDFVLSNQSVLDLVITDLVRYALEHNIDINQVYRKVNLDEFFPRKASKWQRFLLSRYPINPNKFIQIVYEKCKQNVDIAKIKFIETFLNEVSPDYGTEVYYPALNVSRNNENLPIEIRIRYSVDDSNCYVEYRKLSLKAARNNHVNTIEWEQICDIYSVGYGAIRDNTTIINHSGAPYTVSFISLWHAKSFMSSLDGYYRLTRKCYFHLCRDITSPFLDQLKKNRSHGPIGWEFARSKLMHNRRTGSYLVRCCLEQRDTLLIDISLDSGIILTLEIGWNSRQNLYKLIDSSATTSQEIFIKTDSEYYLSLRALISDVQIRIKVRKAGAVPQQLKYWLQPSEYDDCPPLLLSLNKAKLDEIESREDNKINSSISELPKFIPPDMLKLEESLITTSSNRMTVNLGTFLDKRKVVVKSLTDIANVQKLGENESLVFHSCREAQKDHRVLQTYDPAQTRLSDWIFIKYRAFADCIGIYIANNALVQEHFPLGPLDKFLSRNVRITSYAKLLISSQIADALLYLQEKRIIHGKIRCHNIFLSKLHPMEVKIADPLGTFNPAEDQAFLPPEYMGLRLRTCVSDYDSAIDVWALGTTLWQVYSCGRRPPPRKFANSLLQPVDCPNKVWEIIESCWNPDPCFRATPQSIHRDLDDLYIWEKEAHNYYQILEEDHESIEPSPSSSQTPTNSPKTNLSSSNQFTTTPTTSSINSQNDSMHPLIARPTTTPVKAQPANSKQQSSYHIIDDIIRKSWKDVFYFHARPNYKYGLARLDEYVDTSLKSCSTPTGSDTTKTTNVFDLDSLSGQIEESIWHVDSKNLKLGMEIGRGVSGLVRKGVLSREEEFGDQVVAVKCLDEENFHDKSKIEDLRREFDILKNLTHENIVQIIGIVDELSMMLVMEYLPLGSLQSYLINSRENLHDLPLQKYALDIAHGMDYLESMKIVHRDLALRNILVENQEHVKICDFGLAQFLGADNYYKLKTDRALPLKWYAPEVLNDWTFTHKTDSWSYGVVLWQIYSGGSIPQYSGTYSTLSETLEHERLMMPRDCPLSMYDLMIDCWAKDPNVRLSFGQICERLKQLRISGL